MALFLDISQWQDKNMDWAALKKSVDGVILRIGYRGWGSAGTLVVDNLFNTFLTNCNKHDIPTGCYFFSQAKNATEGKAEANFALKYYKKSNMKLPLFIDSENSTGYPNGRADGISQKSRTDAVCAFCDTVKAAGYQTGVYASASWFSHQLDYSRVKGYLKWVAAYGSSENALKKTWGISSWYLWQYTSQGSLDAYNGKNKDQLDFSVPGADFKAATNIGSTNNVVINKNPVVNSVKDYNLEVKWNGYIWQTYSNKLGKFVQYTGVAPNAAGWWYCKDGVVDFKNNSVEHNDYGWWATFDGRVNFGFTGWRNNAAGRWWCVKGEVSFSKTTHRAAAEIWRGDYGNEPKRTPAMKKAGFSDSQIKEIYAAVRKGVGKNELR